MSNTNTLRKVFISAIAAFFVCGSLVGCATYIPVQTGTCEDGRKWVPPAKTDGGQWKAGYCTNN